MNEVLTKIYFILLVFIRQSTSLYGGVTGKVDRRAAQGIVLFTFWKLFSYVCLISGWVYGKFLLIFTWQSVKHSVKVLNLILDAFWTMQKFVFRNSSYLKRNFFCFSLVTNIDYISHYKLVDRQKAMLYARAFAIADKDQDQLICMNVRKDP